MTYKMKLLRHIDTLITYTEKLEYLNTKMLNATNAHYELAILEVIEGLQKWGK